MSWRESLGVGERRWKKAPDEEVQPAKTLWDWLQLLIVPAILIGVTFAWSATQTRSDNKREDRRIAADRAAAEEARQDATLNGYIQQMSDLMLNKTLSSSKRGDAVRSVARTVTLTTLRRLDGERKGEVVRFLAEARLIGVNWLALDEATATSAAASAPVKAVVDLTRADLRDASLMDAALPGVDLPMTDLTGADLTGAWLIDADLGGADLTGADLTGARLDDVDLGGAHIVNANLRDAVLSGAFLRESDLRDAVLADAYLTGANVTGANVTGANLTGANLTGAILTGAKGLSRKRVGVACGLSLCCPCLSWSAPWSRP